MAERSIVAVDIDSVLADSLPYERRFIMGLTGVVIDPIDYSRPDEYWGYAERVWDDCGVDVPAALNRLDRIMTTDQSGIQPIPGAVEAVVALAGHYDVVAVSSRPPRWMGTTRTWLTHHFDGAIVDLRLAGRKDTNSKGEECLEVGAKHLIDDFQGHCLSALDAEVDASLFGNYPWHGSAPSHLRRLADWSAVLKHFAETA